MPPVTPVDAVIQQEIEAIYQVYSALVRGVAVDGGLGGKLVYTGELNEQGSRFVRAANIAGAASLTASSDAAVQRQAIRDGVIDFLVTSLDEALRILKNEIRKRNAVAVGVAVETSKVVEEMRERGVLPDLLPVAIGAVVEGFIAQGAQMISTEPLPPGRALIIVPNAPADFEQRALPFIPQEDGAARRWLRSSPRYLGAQARRLRSVPCDAEIAAKLMAFLGAGLPPGSNSFDPRP